MPNVGVHLRRTLCAVRVERIVRNFILAVWLFHFPFKSKSPSPLHLCSASSRSVHFQCERRRSPSAHLVRRRCGTLCSGCYFGCSAVPFSNPGIRFAVGPSRRSYPGIIIIIPNVSVHRRRTLCAVRCDALFGFSFWLFMPWTCLKS